MFKSKAHQKYTLLGSGKSSKATVPKTYLISSIIRVNDKQLLIQCHNKEACEWVENVVDSIKDIANLERQLILFNFTVESKGESQLNIIGKTEDDIENLLKSRAFIALFSPTLTFSSFESSQPKPMPYPHE
jgi:hypothetical protein